MSKIRRIDFSPDEWLSGTLTMKADERGCYITVCALIYSNGGPIPDSDRDLIHACNVTPERWAKIKNALIGAGKIVATGGMIGNRRCEIELEKARNRTEKARENGAVGGVRSRESRRKSAGNRGEIALNSTGNPSEIEPNSASVSCKSNVISEADALLQNEANHQPSTTNHQESEDSIESSGAVAPERPEDLFYGLDDEPKPRLSSKATESRCFEMGRKVFGKNGGAMTTKINRRCSGGWPETLKIFEIGLTKHDPKTWLAKVANGKGSARADVVLEETTALYEAWGVS